MTLMAILFRLQRKIEHSSVKSKLMRLEVKSSEFLDALLFNSVSKTFAKLLLRYLESK